VGLGTARGSASPSIRARKVVVIWMIGSGSNAEGAGSGPLGDGICADAVAISVNAAKAATHKPLMNIPIRRLRQAFIQSIWYRQDQPIPSAIATSACILVGFYAGLMTAGGRGGSDIPLGEIVGNAAFEVPP